MSILNYLYNHCLLCDEICKTDDSLSKLLKINVNFNFETSHFVVMPDISPIIDDHYLIVSRQHINSIAELININTNVLSELIYLKKQINKVLFNSINSYSFFEHGNISGTPYSTNCISHAHIHVIPISFNIEPYLKSISNYYIKLNKDKKLYSIYNEIYFDYIYFENNVNIFVLNTTDMILPKQYFRKIIADRFNIQYWDWRNKILKNEYY